MPRGKGKGAGKDAGKGAGKGAHRHADAGKGAGKGRAVPRPRVHSLYNAAHRHADAGRWVRFPTLSPGMWFRSLAHGSSRCKAYRQGPGVEYAYTLNQGELFGPVVWSEDDPCNTRRAVMVPARNSTEYVFITVWVLHNRSGRPVGVWFADEVAPP